MIRLAALASIFIALPAQAWGPDGHQTVGTIAAALLKGTPTEARVAELLGNISLPLAAVWADCAKGVVLNSAEPDRYPKKGQYAECAPLETPERIAEMVDYVRRNDTECTPAPDEEDCHRQVHYTDVAIQRSRYILGFVGTRDDDIVGAASAAILVLQGKPAPPVVRLKSRREALLLLAHLIGDLHQPLHVGAVYLDASGRRIDPDKTGDDKAAFTRGGNRILKARSQPPKPPEPPIGIAEFVAGFRPPNLHGLWDDVPTSLDPRHVNADWIKAARQVPGNPGEPASWPGRFAGGTLEQAGEAFRGLSFSPKVAGHWSVTLPADYNARMALIKKRQLTLAGARLAQVLRAALQ